MYTKMIFMLVFLFPVQNIFAKNPASVPISHPVYNYFDRIETLGYIQNLLDGVRPYSRAKVAEVLVQVNQKREQLTSIDKRRLDDFLLDFRFEISNQNRHALIPENQSWYSTLASWENFKNDFNRVLNQKYPEEEDHVLIWEDSSNNFYFDY